MSESVANVRKFRISDKRLAHLTEIIRYVFQPVFWKDIDTFKRLRTRYMSDACGTVQPQQRV